MKEEKFLHSRKTSHRLFFGELWNLRGQHNWEKAHTHTHTQNTHLPTTKSSDGEGHRCSRPPTVSGGWAGSCELHHHHWSLR